MFRVTLFSKSKDLWQHILASQNTNTKNRSTLSPLCTVIDTVSF